MRFSGEYAELSHELDMCRGVRPHPRQLNPVVLAAGLLERFAERVPARAYGAGKILKLLTGGRARPFAA